MVNGVEWLRFELPPCLLLPSEGRRRLHSGERAMGAMGARGLPEKSGWSSQGRDEGWVPGGGCIDVHFSLLRVHRSAGS